MQRAPAPSANRALPATLPGLLLVAGLWGFLLLALGALLYVDGGADAAGTRAPIATWFDARTGAILWSATSQAMLSALGSLAVAVPASIMLARRYRWFGMRVLRLLVGLAFVIPTTVAASGLLAIWGRQGVVNQAIDAVNAVVPVAVALPELPTFFGLKAVVLAHIFFNAPLMIRVFLPRILSVPDTHWRLARMMGMTAWQQGRWIEFPAMKPLILPMVGLVFLFCFSSFSLVLMLGGGLRVTTLEVEIYAALRIAFDLPMAVALTLLQVGMALAVLMILLRLAPRQSSWNQPIMTMRAPCDDILSANSFSLKTLDIFMIAILVLLLILPLAALAWRGVSGDVMAVLTSAHFWRAMGNSVGIAVASGVLVVGLACILAETRTQLTLRSPALPSTLTRGGVALLEMGVMVYLVVPAIVMGTAWFILLRGVANVFAVAPFLVLVANVMLGLPVAYRLLIGKWLAMRGRDERSRLAYGLQGWNLRGWRGVRFLTIPLMGREIGLIFGLGMAMSMGDLGVIALFASADFMTLPWLLYQQAGRYRVDEAAVTALMLMLVVSALFALGNGLGRWPRAPAQPYSRPTPPHPPFMTRRAMLKIDNIKFQYPEQTHPLKFALNVPENTALVVAGISGSGKSTLLNLIAGFLHPDSGDVRWRQKSILGLAPAARPISMLFQSDNLFAHLDVWTNIALGVDAGLAIDSESTEIIAQSMADLGIGDMETRPIPTLSGGQQQRVALVRALVRARLHAAGGAGGVPVRVRYCCWMNRSARLTPSPKPIAWRWCGGWSMISA